MLKIIDTHLHIWNRDELMMPWLTDAGEPLCRNYSFEDYLSAQNGNDLYKIEKAVYIEVDVEASQRDIENTYILNMCKKSDNLIYGASISGDLTNTHFKEYIKKYAPEEAVKGVRQVLHVPSAKPKTCLAANFIDNVKLLGKFGLVFEGCVRTEELEDLFSLAQQCSETRIVLDHMGIVDPDIISTQSPTEGEKVYREKWQDNMRKLASLDNVVCKISGLNPAGKWSVETLQPAVETVISEFGADRIMFASNYPVCNISTKLDPWIRALIEITGKRSEQFRQKLFYENAKTIYQL